MTEPDLIDIAYHMPELERIASQCETIVELGVGNGNGSTRAFVRGLIKSSFRAPLMISVDHDCDRPVEKPRVPFWAPLYGDTRDPITARRAWQMISIFPLHLIFVDTHHTPEQMRQELEVWYPITCPETVWLFHDTWMQGTYNPMTDVIKEFAAAHPPLVYVDLSRQSHGLGMMAAFKGLNAGSGQRPFGKGWINIDCQEKWREGSDRVGGTFINSDMRSLPVTDNSLQYVVAHHVLEHFDVGDSDGLVKEAYRVLRPGGKFLVFVPDMQMVCHRWLRHEIDLETFRPIVYGAYMGNEADRHKQCWNLGELNSYLLRCAPWKSISKFGNKQIEGADIAGWDWWILDLECEK